MGPLETIDLNAPGGIADYLRRYGPLYQAIEREHAEARWTGPTRRCCAGSTSERRARSWRWSELGERSAWRDRRLMALAAQKRKAAQKRSANEQGEAANGPRQGDHLAAR